MSIFVQRLSEELARHNMKPDHLAKKAGLSHYCLYSWMRGKRTPNAINLAAIADVLGVSMDWLWGRK